MYSRLAYGFAFTVMVSASLQSASAPYSRIIHSVRSMYGREMTPSVMRSCSPFFSVGAIISSAEIYCELMLPATSMYPPSSVRPLMRSGG